MVAQFATAPGGGFFEGTINVTQMSVGTPVNNLISIAFNFTGNGSLQHLP